MIIYNELYSQEHDGRRNEDCWHQGAGISRKCQAHQRRPHQEGSDEDQEGAHCFQEEARGG